jgi:hypothetical protein
MRYFAVIFFLLLMGGCDLFNARDAEIPSQSRSNYQIAVTPDIVIMNLVYSLKDMNKQNYLSCFSDISFSGKSFLFYPSSEAASLYPSFASPWDKNNEGSYFNNLIPSIPKGLPVTLDLTNPSSSIQGDSLIYTASYSLAVPFTDSSIPSLYKGDLKFYMILDSRNVWSIYLWQDIKSTQFPSWSELKGRLY